MRTNVEPPSLLKVVPCLMAMGLRPKAYGIVCHLSIFEASPREKFWKCTKKFAQSLL